MSLVTAAGERASLRFLEFFAASIRNLHTRRAYYRAAAEFLAWCAGAGLRGDPKGPLFRTIGAMIRRRAAAAGIETRLGNHSFRATAITPYLKNGGTIEKAAATANHASTRTTQLYNRRRDEFSLDEVERIVI